MPKEKQKKKPSKYALFIKANYDSVRDKPLRERFKILAKRWRARVSPAQKA